MHSRSHLRSAATLQLQFFFYCNAHTPGVMTFLLRVGDWTLTTSTKSRMQYADSARGTGSAAFATSAWPVAALPAGRRPRA